VSAQIPVDSFGDIVSADIPSQTKQVMKNIGEILYIAKSSIDNIIKTTIYLKNLNSLKDVNEVYSSYFQSKSPATSIVEVSNLSEGALIQIDCIATE
jgi:2-iminobutanoate/2-iminopropanoate deaminase